MSFVVEDGTGKADANSYQSVEGADAYFLDRGVTAWAAMAQTDKQAALVQATDYIDLRFGTRFASEQQFTEDPAQGLQFPRVGLGMPLALLRAASEYALRAHTAPLAPDPVLHESGYAVAEIKEKVGPLEETTKFATENRSRASLLRPYPAADMLIKGLLKSVSNRVVRN